MSVRQKREAPDDSDLPTRSEENEISLSSKDDENLIQNWSLTFTEYMQDATPIKEHDLAQGYEAHDNGLDALEENGDTRAEIDTVEADAENEVIESQERQGGHTTKPVHIHVETGGLETATNATSDVGTERAPIETADETRIADNGDKLRETRKQINEDVQWYKEDLQEQLDLKKERITAAKQNLSKHRVLPSINAASNEAKLSHEKTPAELPKQKDSNDEEHVSDKTESSDVKVRSDKPAVNGDTVGKVQPIYMRFPGQRTGQMVL